MTSFLCLTQRSSSSILQSSILSVYIAFLTCSALASFPTTESETSTTRCRDFTFIQSFFNGENEQLPKNVSQIESLSIISSSDRFGSSPLVYNAVEDVPKVSLDWLLRATALLFAILSGCYTSFRNVSGFSEVGDIPSQPMFCCGGEAVSNSYDPAVAYIDDEAESLQYK